MDRLECPFQIIGYCTGDCLNFSEILNNVDKAAKAAGMSIDDYLKSSDVRNAFQRPMATRVMTAISTPIARAMCNNNPAN